MSELMDALGAIGGLAFGGGIILLIAPILGSQVPVNLSALGFLFFGGAVILTIALIIIVVQTILSAL
jgi:hypothetical protein